MEKNMDNEMEATTKGLGIVSSVSLACIPPWGFVFGACGWRLGDKSFECRVSVCWLRFADRFLDQTLVADCMLFLPLSLKPSTYLTINPKPI